MAFFAKKPKWNSASFSAAETAFAAVSDPAELLQVVQSCRHPLLRLRAAKALHGDALLAGYMEQKTAAYQQACEKKRRDFSKARQDSNTERVLASCLKDLDDQHAIAPCEVIWVCGASSGLLRRWAEDPLLPPYAREEAAAKLDPDMAQSLAQPLPLLSLISATPVPANAEQAAFCYLMLLIRVYRAYPEGFARPAEDWPSLEVFAAEGAKFPEGAAHKAYCAQLVRAAGFRSDQIWRSAELFSRFSFIMPQGENLRSMWAGYLK